MRIALTILFSVSMSAAMAAEPKYPVSAIPEDLKQGMYAVVRESESKFYIDSRGQSSLYIRSVTTILNSKANFLAEVAVNYDKLKKIDGLKANVYDAAGNLIKKLKQSEIIDQSAISGFSLFEDDRVKYADLSQTTYPYTVEIEYTLTMRYLYSIPDFYLYSDDEVATQKESFVIIYPKDLKPRYRLFKIEQPQIRTEPDKRESMTWTFENTKPNKFERLGPGIDKVVPNIKTGPGLFDYDGHAGNMSTWGDYGKWLAQLNSGRDILPEATKKKIRDITKDLKTTEEKTRALYAYLQGKTRYVSIQLGIGGLQPFDAATVDQTGYGDCKGLSNYMVAILKEAGIKGYYATIMSGDNAPDVTIDFPGHQANHAIVAVPNNSDTLWLECTSQTNPFGYLGRFTGDRKALLITENGGKLVHTTRYPVGQNIQTRFAEVDVTRTGDAKAKVRTTYSGLQYENGNLNFVVNYQYDEQKKWIQKNTSIPNFDVTSFNMADRKDKIPSATVKADLDLRRFATVSGKRIFITPNLMNRSTSVPDKAETRSTNVVLKSGFTHVDTIRYRLPEGIYPEFMPQPVKLSSRFGEYEASFTLDQDNLVYIRKLKMNNGEFPAESYNELIEFYRNLNKADNTKMVFLSKT
jgi:transglutaminase-like putative cysteine protease